MQKTVFAIAVAVLASSAWAGTTVAPGPIQSAPGSLIALPGIAEAIGGSGGTPGIVTLPNPLNPTQVQNIANAYGVPYVPGRPLTVLDVVIVGADGRPISADLLISGEGVATLELAANEVLASVCT